MANIKFSALVSDIKGKYEGSVFSGGTSGTIMRNQPSGGGRKSAKWNNQKAILSGITSSWRALTEEQQTAWNNAAPLFPKTNKFGDPRIPSGYEVFTSVNTTLQSVGAQTLMNPVAPRALETPNAINFYFPSEQVLVPESQPRIVSRSGNATTAVSIDVLSDSDLTTLNAVSCRLNLAPLVSEPIRKNQLYPLFNASLENGVKFGLFLIYNLDGTSTVHWRVQLPVFEGQYTMLQRSFNISAAQTSTSIFYMLYFDFAGETNTQLSFGSQGTVAASSGWFVGDDEFLSLDITGISTAAPSLPDMSSVTGRFSLGCYNTTIKTPFAPNDFRFWNSVDAPQLSTPSGAEDLSAFFTPVEVFTGCTLLSPIGDYANGMEGLQDSYTSQMVYSGYILENETMIVPFGNRVELGYDNIAGNGRFLLSDDPELNCCNFPTCGTLDESQCVLECICVADIQDDNNSFDLAYNPTPLVWSSGVTAAENDLIFRIVSSGSISYGVSGLNSKQVKIATLPLDGSFAQLKSVLSETFGQIAFNSDFTINVQLVDLQTGVSRVHAAPVNLWEVTNKSNGKKKKKVRFKGGSDLADKVN